jgi:hypothetical protein
MGFGEVKNLNKVLKGINELPHRSVHLILKPGGFFLFGITSNFVKEGENKISVFKLVH